MNKKLKFHVAEFLQIIHNSCGIMFQKKLAIKIIKPLNYSYIIFKYYVTFETYHLQQLNR